MPSFDLHSNIDNRIVFSAEIFDGVNSVTIAGEIIDTSGFQSIEFVIQSGLVGSAMFSFLIEQGDDAGLSDAATVPSEEILGNLDGFTGGVGSSDTTMRVGSIGKKRYQRLSIIGTNEGGGPVQGIFTAVALLGHSHTAPVAQ